MDTFRRIRSRRKSKGQADGFTTFADAESSYRSASDAWQPSTTRSSATGGRPSDVAVDKKISHEQMTQPKSPAEYQRSGSSSRIQPMLIGISRPSNTESRPGTAESIQKALDRAAESVQQQPRGTLSSVSHVGLRGGRYVDIFAISGQTGKPTRTFNEDVAERNLDAVALMVGEQHYLYEPTSKYQEEVAARNAHQIAAQRRSSIRRQHLSERVKPTNDRSVSAQSGSYAHQALLEPDTDRSRRDQDPAAYHSRRHGSRNRDASQKLPAIPQERSSEDIEVLVVKDLDTVRAAEEELETAKAHWLRAQYHCQADSPPDMDKPLPASPRQKDLTQHLGIPPYANAPNHTSIRADTRPARKSKHDSVQGNGYENDRRLNRPAEPPGPHDSASRQAIQASQSQRRGRAGEGTRRLDNRHSSSNSSNPSYKRLLVGNRTIIDFTEAEAEAASVASYLQTPVIEDARADAFQKVIPTVVEHLTPPRVVEKEDGGLGSHRSSALEPVLDLDQLARRSQIMSETAAAVARSQPIQTRVKERPRIPPQPSLAFSPIKTLTSSSPPKTITFSPITTLTTTSPRSSQEVLVTQSSATGAGHRPRDIAASNQPVGNTPHPPVTYSGSKSNARISANIAPLVRIFADVKPEDSEATRSSGSGKPRSTHTESDRRKTKEVSNSSKKEGKRRERSIEAEIRRTARSIIPAGPLDQEPTPGVKTRDFATLPLEKPTSKRINALVEKKRAQIESRKSSKERTGSSRSSSEGKKAHHRTTKSVNKVVFNDNPVSSAILPQKPEKRSEKKSKKKSAKSNSSATRKARPISLFDEAAFEKKHAEANAALLRLQQSLQQPLEVDPERSLTPRDTDTPISRTLSPVDSVIKGLSPSPQPMPQPSPAAAAIAMINAATSSTRPPSRSVHTKASSDLGQKSQGTKPLPSIPRLNTEETVPTLKNTTLTTLINMDPNNRPPRSPGEVSLSSFPIPSGTPRAISPDESNKSPPAYVKDVGAPVRRGSQTSRVSSASAFSIPFTMVPDRTGSLPEHRIGVPGPSVTPRMDSIDAIIPPKRSVEVTSP